MRKRNVKQGLAYLLCLALVFEGTGLTVSAEGAQVSTQAVVLDEQLVSDGNSVSDNDAVSENVVQIFSETASSTENIASGTYYGMDWVIDGTGHLTISGACTGTLGANDVIWTTHSDSITSATVTATGVTSTNCWFYSCTNLTQIDFSSFSTSAVTDMSSMFSDCSALTDLDVSGFNTSNVTKMGGMFAGCSALTTLDVSKFDTTNVTDPSGMFSGCSSLTALDVSGFDTSQATDMRAMFKNCGKLTALDVSKFNTANVRYMSNMFSGCSGLTSLDVSGFDTGWVLYFREMFSGCSNLTSLDVSNFETTEATDMGKMFQGCSSLASLDMSSFDMSKVEIAEMMLEGCSALATIKTPLRLGVRVVLPFVYLDEQNTTYICVPMNQTETVALQKDTSVVESGTCYGLLWTIDEVGHLTISGEYTESATTWGDVKWNVHKEKIKSVKVTATGVTSTEKWFQGMANLTSVDLSEFDTSQVTDMSWMFDGCSGLTALDVSGFDTSQVEDFSRMFDGCSSLTTLDVSKFNTSKATGFATMFGDCSGLTTLDVSGFDTSQAEELGSMFYKCSNLTSLDVSKFDTSKAKSLHNMFSRCTGLQTLDVSGFDTSQVEDMGLMFDGCTGLTSLDVSKFDTSKVTNMNAMFAFCSNLTSLDVSAFDTSQVENFGVMFSDCSSLTTLDVSKFNTTKATNMNGMFGGCTNIKELNVSGFDTALVEDMSLMFADCSSLSSLDVSKFNTSKVTDMGAMFRRCSSLTNLDVSSFNTGELTDAGTMFSGCSGLTALDLSSFDMAKVTKVIGMLGNCTAFRTLKTPRNLNLSVNLFLTMYDEAGNAYTELPTGLNTSITLTAGDAEDDNDGGNSDGTDNGGDGVTDDKGEDESTGTEDGEDSTGTGDGDDAGDGDEADVVRVLTINPIPNQKYTGKALKPEVVVTYGREVLQLGRDYTVSYKNNTNAAKADDVKAPVAIVKGKGNFEGTVTLAFNILAKEMTEENTSVAEMIFNENGKVQAVKPTVTVSGKKLAVGKDYLVDYSDKTDGAYKNAGTYNIVIRGTGNYQGSIVTTMTILGENQIMASKLKVDKIAAVDYVEGTPATPTPEVSYKGTKLELGEDYAISYVNNDRAGKATLIITGLKNIEGTYVAGSVKKTFTIKGIALKKAKAEYNNKVLYTGSAVCPEITLKLGEMTLRPGIDYAVEYTKNVNVGKGTIILTGMGGYTGTVKKTFTIQADATVADKLNVSFTGGKAEAAFDAKGAKPAVKVMLGNTVLKLGKDYTVSYKNNKKLAAADAAKAPTVVIKGKGNYKFTKNVTFSIVEKYLTDADISVESADKFVGGKKGYISAPVVKDGNGKKLKANKDYKVVGYTANGAAFDGSGEVLAGTTVTVTVEGMGNYKGQTNTTYRIANSDISKVQVNKPKLEYNGGKVKFTEEMLVEGKLELADKTTGKKLVYGTDFIVVGYKNNTKKGTATVTVQGIGEYGGTKNVKFSIVSKKLK